MRARTLALVVGVVLVFALGIFAGRQLWRMGSVNPPGKPEATSSFTLENVYLKLKDGTSATKSTFTEPTTPPGQGTMYTLDQIMGQVPAKRFVDVGDGTIKDTHMKLMWLKSINTGAMTWDSAKTFCENLVYPLGGYSDWRLPEIWELYSLVDKRRSNPALPAGHPFSSSRWYNTWSATPYWSDRTHAMQINMNPGNVYDANKDDGNIDVYPVRNY
ncbi:DUF1566 domain-containing protein [Candidatus Bipolaricaulota bacterium]